jgi:hypothetical protein
MRKLISFFGEHKWFLITLVIAVFMAFIRFNSGVVQQDNYIGYAKLFPDSVNKISFFDSRLFPGLPFIIYLLNFLTRDFFISGYVITFLSLIASYFLLFKITKSKLSFLPLIIPPIMLNLATLINTELPFIFLMLLAYWFLKKEKLSLAFLIIGLSIWFRLVGLGVLFGVFVYFLIKRNLKDFLLNLPYFLIPVVALLIYNVHFFGSNNLFYQLTTYGELHPGRINIGLFQLFSDLARAVRWHWYRIFFSGLIYTIFFAFCWIKSIKLKSLEFWIITGIYIFTLSLNFVPFLENIGRYLAPAVPIFWIIFHKKLENIRLLYLLIPISVLVVLV